MSSNNKQSEVVLSSSLPNFLPPNNIPDPHLTLVMDAGAPAPNQYIILTDVSAADLHGTIATQLGVRYLHDIPHPTSQAFGVNGIVFGRNNRYFVPLTIMLGGKSKAVIFLIDTGSPFLYMCKEVCIAINPFFPFDSALVVGHARNKI
jgi:hypothetical protein